jgi:hypothetical protein
LQVCERRLLEETRIWCESRIERRVLEERRIERRVLEDREESVRGGD